MPARNTMVQLLASYIDHESHSAQRYRQTDRRHAYDSSRSYCVAVRSAKKRSKLKMWHTGTVCSCLVVVVLILC